MKSSWIWPREVQRAVHKWYGLPLVLAVVCVSFIANILRKNN